MANDAYEVCIAGAQVVQEAVNVLLPQALMGLDALLEGNLPLAQRRLKETRRLAGALGWARPDLQGGISCLEEA